MIGNRYDAMKGALDDARATMSAADTVASDFARILIGRLRKVSPGLLRSLKRELTEFNAHTGRWRS